MLKFIFGKQIKEEVRKVTEAQEFTNKVLLAEFCNKAIIDLFSKEEITEETSSGWSQLRKDQMVNRMKEGIAQIILDEIHDQNIKILSSYTGKEEFIDSVVKRILAKQLN